MNRKQYTDTVGMADVHDCSNSKSSSSNQKNLSKAKHKKLLSCSYAIRRRKPIDLRKQSVKDIFVTNKTNFKAQLKKCEKLLDNDASEIIIHGLGAAIHRACHLALRLKEIHYNGIDLDIKTSTASVVDDFEPLNDETDYETISRNKSAVHIRVFRKFLIGGLKYQE